MMRQKYPASLSFAADVASLGWGGGGSLFLTTLSRGAWGDVAPGQLSHRPGKPILDAETGHAGALGQAQGAGLASGDTHAPGRSSWGEMPTSLGLEGRGRGEGALGPGPPHTVAFSL